MKAGRSPIEASTSITRWTADARGLRNPNRLNRTQRWFGLAPPTIVTCGQSEERQSSIACPNKHPSFQWSSFEWPSLESQGAGGKLALSCLEAYAPKKDS